MREEYELEVLEQYHIEVKGTRRIRGAFFCDTNEGTMLLKETGISGRRAPLLYEVLSRIEKRGNIKVDTPVFTKDGKLLVTSGEGTVYMLKKWYPGRECDIRQEGEVLRAAGLLGSLHRELDALLSEWRPVPPEEAFPPGRDPVDEILRHNRELKKVRSFIRARTAKNEFEYLYLESFEKMFGMAEKVLGKMQASGCMKLYRQSVDQGRMIHGDYNYHNVIMLKDGIAVTGFENMRTDIQVNDLYYFIRKAMEKHHWKQNFSKHMRRNALLPRKKRSILVFPWRIRRSSGRQQGATIVPIRRGCRKNMLKNSGWQCARRRKRIIFWRKYFL